MNRHDDPCHQTLQSVSYEPRPVIRLDLANAHAGRGARMEAQRYGCRALTIVVDDKGQHAVHVGGLSQKEVSALLRLALSDILLEEIDGKISV